MDTSKRALLDFVKSAVDKGRINKNTGGGMKAACVKILEQINEEEDVRNIDVSAEVKRYNNRHPNELSSSSLRVYESRVRAAIEAFVGSLTDPTGYRMPSRSNGTKMKAGSKRGSERVSSSLSGGDDLSPPPPSASSVRAVATDLSLALPFPLRPNFLAQVVVPRDLTREEAKRLSAFIDALAHDHHKTE